VQFPRLKKGCYNVLLLFKPESSAQHSSCSGETKLAGVENLQFLKSKQLSVFEFVETIAF